ncbi:agmatinase [Paenibacillus sp. V4I9]|uniref:agmatinase n=1 Tax=Paenibacillus sp. V4I9 TaxID=3042308 RepID=UPI00277D1D3B|nr:agmatinase [Paenibacillus sp. V4I9]MDQ0891779.1 agmatinase [Paenibacillus sp. V4I9]
MIKYKPDASFKQPRFSGITTFMRLPHVQTLEEIDFLVAGVPFDTGQTFRTGARFGPKAIRESSVLTRTFSPYHQLNLFDYVSGVDYGDISVIPGFIKETYDKMVEELTPIYEKGIVPIIIGGDHSITLGELRAAAKTYGPLALLQFDSHCDTWDTYFGQKYTHGTPFRRAVEEGLIDTAHSIQIGIRGSLNHPNDVQDAKDLGFQVVTTEELVEMGTDKIVSMIRERVQDRPVFMTFDIDFIDPAFAPGTGTPEVGGVMSREALAILRRLNEIRFIGFDLVETLPAYDHDQITSALAANLIFEMISLIALQKRKEQALALALDVPNAL